MIHYYICQEQTMMICANLEEVTDMLYELSPFAQSSHERINKDLINYLRDLNQRLPKILDQEDLRKEYIRGVISYQFLAPILGIDLNEEKGAFSEYFQKERKINDPLRIHFVIEGEEECITLDTIIPTIQNAPIFVHKTPTGLSHNVYLQTDDELKKLERKWSEDQVLITTGYLMLASAFGHRPSIFKERFKEATKEQPTYALIFPSIDSESD